MTAGYKGRHETRREGGKEEEDDDEEEEGREAEPIYVGFF